MSGRIRRLWLAIGLGGILFFVILGRAFAQSAYHVDLTTLDTSSFPQISAYLSAHDTAGGFVHGLTTADVAMQENDVQLPVTKLVEEKPGVQFVLAISPGSTFGIRDSSGTTRFEYLVKGLVPGSWATQPPDSDDFSLLTLGGPQFSHSPNPEALLNALESYSPGEVNSAPNLEVLASALQIASDPTPRPGMERAILFITPPQPSEVSLGLQSILTSANQQNIHIFVWMLAAPEVFDLPEVDQLRNLADQTQGVFFAFSHDEPIPDLETILEPLRYAYQLGYESHIAKTGAQQVAVRVSIGGEQITSQPLAFELNLQPPAVLVLNSLVEVGRRFITQPTPGAENTPSLLIPEQELIKFKVSFPDGYPRSLVRTSLYVDGALAAENSSAPFDQLVWDLRPYTQAGTHILRIEATDSLGWTGKTGEISVKISVPSTSQEVAVVVLRKPGYVIAITALISASILFLALIVAGRIRPKPYPGQTRSSRIGALKTRRAGLFGRIRPQGERVFQPQGNRTTHPAQSAGILAKLFGMLHWRTNIEPPINALAYLMPLVGSDEPTLASPLKITGEAVNLGSDLHKADLVISDPSIEGLHARIQRDGSSFKIVDAGSVAGTWVNFEQVPSAGTSLEHADIIHLGRIGFRFNLSEPGSPRKVIVTPLEPDR